MNINIHIDENSQQLCRDCIYSKQEAWTPALVCEHDDTCYFRKFYCEKRISKKNIHDQADAIRKMVEIMPDEELVKVFNR